MKFQLIEDEELYNHLLRQEEELITLFQAMPNLYYLPVEMAHMWLDGYQWQSLITNSVPQLKTFRCKMEKWFSVFPIANSEIDNLFQSFRTDFGIEIHQIYANMAYDMEKCVDLARSPLGKQGEILTIRVTSIEYDRLMNKTTWISYRYYTYLDPRQISFSKVILLSSYFIKRKGLKLRWCQSC